ncbi:NADH-ubiquinone oxidoreductase-F iron-sulfur binding region domain-containing protein [Psychromicrobium xiongbiense]|uniref:NADH-ubiquinone oxidoreductase-F iron-sulfur binding region domain-containing protein n=1 Tax=Psychromicrobium xiongbiense TaxID=3051184 RepID=UPI002555E654|nr:NADH-ubiquinone oxidoreductase-F iron-sulfur binding region domain-containing protein [Psychromicrobium sp. YIM S02556]
MSAAPAPVPGPLAPDGARRLFAAGNRADWSRHVARFGALDLAGIGPAWLTLLAESGLTGRGGAQFPLWRKVEAVRSAADSAGLTMSPVVVANGVEGEPLSEKDRTLLTHAPHLVLDGLAVASRLVGAKASYLCLSTEIPELSAAIAARPAGAQGTRKRPVLVQTEARFIAGEASAVVQAIATGRSTPRTHVDRLSTRGLKGRPTLVNNVETLAQLGLLARFGAAWFRSVGTSTDPGTRLVTVHFGDGEPRVLEVPGGVGLAEVLGYCGIGVDRVEALLVGGYHGCWVPRDQIQRLTLGGPLGMAPGAGILYALPRGQCGLRASSRIADYLASQSTGQCGPCRFGLPSVAGLFRDLVHGDSGFQGQSGAELARLNHLVGLLPGRGACHHPDGSARFIADALTVFHEDLLAHAHGRCLAGSARPQAHTQPLGARRLEVG